MLYFQESGGAEKFTSFIEKELIPYIESNYSATNYRTLIGHSYAGLFTINTLIKHKSLFMSLSGQLHMQTPLVTIDNVMQDSSGFTLFARSNIEFLEYAKANKQNDLSLAWKFYPRDLHGTITLPSIMENMDMQQIEKSKMFFEFAIEYYPQSANAYDSMADFYEAQKDIPNALKYVSKAYEISGDDRYKMRMGDLKR